MPKHFETYTGTATLRVTTYSGETVALSERDAVAVSGKAGFFRVDVSALAAGTYDFVFAGGIGADLDVEIGSADGVYRSDPLIDVPKYGDEQQRDKTSATVDRLIETVTKVVS